MKKDFEFVIRDNLVYYTWNEIKSSVAKNLYTKVVSLKREIAALEKKLDALRLDYSKSPAKRSQLATKIQDAETQLEQLIEQPAALEKEARNAEINYLLTKK